MPKSEQRTTYRRNSRGELISETEGKDYDATGTVAMEEKHEKAMRAMTSGAKPKVSDEEPPPGTVSHIAWERRQKAREQGQKKALAGM